MEYRFGPYTLEPAERRISGDGKARIELTAKAFDLLLLLVSRSGQLVTKDEILDEVWQDVSIAESNVTTTISMIRKALREDSEHRYVETIPKKGYRFIAPVTLEVTGARPVEEPPRADMVPVTPPKEHLLAPTFQPRARWAGFTSCRRWPLVLAFVSDARIRNPDAECYPT